MASADLVERIERDFLSCCICFEELKDPIGLPCLHGFCFECLDRWSKTNRDMTKVVCPTCKKSVPMPKEGIRGFPGHFLVKNLKETVDTVKVSCSHERGSFIFQLNKLLFFGSLNVT